MKTSVNKSIFAVFAFGCATAGYDEFDSGDTVEVMCSHPVSQFEAQVEVSYADGGYTGVEFVLGQHEEWWVVDLWQPNEQINTWHTTMQILEFDCNNEWTYDFIIDR